jgi:hypothetical protein
LELKTLGQIARSSTSKFGTAELRRKIHQAKEKTRKKTDKKANGHQKAHVLKNNSFERQDDIDECASLIGIALTSRESLVMSRNERTNERHQGWLRSSSSMKTNQFVIKHEARKQRILDKIVIWHKIVQQRRYHILSLFRCFVLGQFCVVAKVAINHWKIYQILATS